MPTIAYLSFRPMMMTGKKSAPTPTLNMIGLRQDDP
jgi:hypothetical protein